MQNNYLRNHLADTIENKGFISSFFTYASLPQSDPKTTEYVRHINFGSTSLSLHVYSKYGVPYGVIPRRLYAWIGKEAIQTKSRLINLGRTQTSFLSNIDSINSGGKNGAITALKKQAEKLFNSFISIECRDNKKWGFQNSIIVDKGSILWTPTEKKSLWNGEITLSQTFFEEITKNPIPVDMDIVKKISSSLALDIYFWFHYKLFGMKYNTFQKIMWNHLFAQFGYGYENSAKGKRNFKPFFIKALNKLILDSTIRCNCISFNKDGIILKKI